MNRFLLAGFLLMIFPLSAARPAFITSGEVMPTDPSTWTTATSGIIGFTDLGALTVDNDSDLLSAVGYLGYLAGAMGTVTVDGSGSTWTNSAGVSVGYYGNGILNVTNGGSVSNTFNCFVGNYAGSKGTVTVSDSGSTWTNSNSLYVGFSGDGTLRIVNGGRVNNTYGIISSSSNATGTVTVDGSGSTWNNSSHLYVGYSNSGVLNIKNAGNVRNASGCIGNNSSSMGIVTVDGFGSVWTNTSVLYVGSSGRGTLNITNGGSVSSIAGYLGLSSGSTGTVTVDGSGSTWVNNTELHIGFFGNGVLSVTNGGIVRTNGYSFIGDDSSSQGTVTVDGPGSTWDSYLLFVGNAGKGTLNILNGGAVSATDSTYVGMSTVSQASLNFGTNGGTLTTQTFYAAPSQVTGTGTINARGLVSDVALAFDATHGIKQVISLSSLPDQNISIHLDMSNDPGYLGAGWNDLGSLTIQDGVIVTSKGGYLGHQRDSTGSAKVNGPGSTWTNSGSLYVGYTGNGTLEITDGGTVHDDMGYISGSSSSTGTVRIDDTGSNWTHSRNLYIGSYGAGSIIQANGTNSVGGTLLLGENSTGTGTYNLNGGTLILKSLGKGSGAAAFNFGGGTLQARTAFSSALPMTLTGTGGDANVDTAGYAVTLSGVLSGPGGLHKQGMGSLTLSAYEAYSGNTTVNGGTLLFTGGISEGGTTLLDVQSGTAILSTTAINKTDLNIVTATSATFEIASGVHTVGTICGSGITQVDNDAVLTAVSISQNTLIIGNGMAAVAEPATFTLFGLSILGLLIWVWRSHKT